MGRRGGVGDLPARQVAGKDEPAGGERAHGVDVSFEIVALDERPNVPVDPEPAEQFDRAVDHLWFDARGVEVLDAQDNPPAVAASHGPVDQEGARVAQMQGAGG